ncbi:DNA repair helicase [Obba rivulosa]|uniref:ATP-dependent DNA helicase CHL1 n=1 Tax=Obba rivulosa TaxID=1052685 RepID=A0A8E2DPN0_9APHY|nr:DNA repair helicase [Obba rivulosa]
MADLSLKLATPSNFPAFPFAPYDIQLSLMKHLYSSIEDRKIAILESPTGTGKTLSLLCGSLTWLADEQARARKGELSLFSQDSSDPDWVLAQTLARRRRELEAADQAYAARLAVARKKDAALRVRARRLGEMRKRPRTSATGVMKADEIHTDIDKEDETFLPEDDDGSSSSGDVEGSNISPAVRALMRQLDPGRHSVHEPGLEPEPTCTKIYYASRTHSQLAQVLHELRSLRFGDSPDHNGFATGKDSSCESSTTSVKAGGSIHPSGTSKKRPISVLLDESNLPASQPASSSVRSGEDTYPDVDNQTRAVSLGARKQLCIHERLRARVGVGELDEACRTMLGEKGDKRCPYLPSVEEETRMLDFRDQILAAPKDIEDLVLAGQASETCPYFGSRRAIPQAQLVLLPYNLLLQKTAREALGIDLTNQVVIIDEAHNLIPTLLSLSTTRLPFRTLATARSQLSIYLNRFRTRLATTHSLHLIRLVGLLDALHKYAEEWREARLKQTRNNGGGKDGAGTENIEIMAPGELLSRLGRKTEGVNLLEVEAYLRRSKIARKISGYSVKAMERAAGKDPVRLGKVAKLANTTPPLHAVESFITALASANEDGRITFALIEGQVEVKYQQLNPATHFREVIDAARSVVLAGGTMSPMSDVINQLFADVPSERLSTFSCGHIIPSSNLKALVLKKGPRGGDLHFKYERRSDQALIAEVGQTLLNFANIVPGGMVVFLPSYSFLHTVKTAWEASGVMDKLASKKKLFIEPQESTQVEAVLRDYAAQIQRPSAPAPSDSSAPLQSTKSGALLFAVIGAKLSEGLNFTDDLARAVVIIGLPFANLASPELRERMNYVNRAAQRRAADVKPVQTAPGAKDAATELYENMCMNAVNQSIGRAIRHRHDWASLILLDSRYASPRIRTKLPKWIGESTTVAESFGEAMKELGGFYREKRAATIQSGCNSVIEG